MLSRIRSYRPPHLLVALLVPVLALVAVLAWGLSSPVGSSPDDDFHLASIWCGHGADGQNCESAPAPSERTVARDLIVGSLCFASDPNSSADCQGDDFGTRPDITIHTDRGNFSGLYPPVFYFALSSLAGPNIENSVLAMRLATSVLFVGLVSILFWLLPLHRRQTLFWSLVVSVVPLGMFLIPSTNPSGWAILSAGTLWIALAGYFESEGWRRIGLGAIAVTATVVGAGARADAAIYAGFAIAVAVLLTFRKDVRWMLSAILPLVLVAVAVVFFASADQGAAATGGLTEGRSDSGVPTTSLALANLLNVPSLWVGVFGAGPIGWQGTSMPSSVWVAGFASFAGAILVGLATGISRKLLAVSATVAALVIVPTVLLVQSRATVGVDFQPRYLLPLIVILAGLALLQSPTERLRATIVQRRIVVAALMVANSLALFTNIRRYVTGNDVSSVDLNAGAEWWWNLPFSPMATWIAGSLAFAAMLVLASTRAFNAPSRFELVKPSSLGSHENVSAN